MNSIEEERKKIRDEILENFRIEHSTEHILENQNASITGKEGPYSIEVVSTLVKMRCNEHGRKLFIEIQDEDRIVFTKEAEIEELGELMLIVRAFVQEDNWTVIKEG